MSHLICVQGSLRSVQSVRGNIMEFLFSNCTPCAVVLGFSFALWNHELVTHKSSVIGKIITLFIGETQLGL